MFSPCRSRGRPSASRVASVFAMVALACSCEANDGADGSDWVAPSIRGAVGASHPRPIPTGAVDASAPTESSTPSATSTSGRASTTTTSSTATTSSTTTTIDPADVLHAYPVDPAVTSSFTPQGHANYQATDLFSSAGCGTRVLAPVTGIVDEVLEDTYDSAVDDPATRGGNAVSIIGDDGVRYYLAHFEVIDPAITPGARVTAGDLLGQMGDTGRSGACNLHFGLSLDCPTDGDWWIRRGVIWPDDYLESWRNGENLSPRPALEEWFEQYPNACQSVDETPYPVS